MTERKSSQKEEIDVDTFDLNKCCASLIFSDPEGRYDSNPHFRQLLECFFGRVISPAQFDRIDRVPVSTKTFFLCGAWQQILPRLQIIRKKSSDTLTSVVLVQEFTYDTDTNQSDDSKESKEERPSTISYRRLALRIPGLFDTNDRLVPLAEDEDWYATLKGSQEWYELMHAKHQEAAALRTGTYCSASGPLSNSVWLQRCSTVFKEATQVFNGVHVRINELQRKADGLFLDQYRDPNIMLIQHYDPTAIIGAHSDKTVDLENLVFRAFSSYEGFSRGKFDNENLKVDDRDYRVWVNSGLKTRPPAIRFLTLIKKESGTPIRVPLPPNWMFIMTDRTHRQWTHEIKKQPHARPRISVTSRFSGTLARYQSDGKVELYRSPSLQQPIGQLKLASRQESDAIDRAYKEQNIMRDALPDYSKVVLCTRNAGDLKVPTAFLAKQTV